MTDLKGKVALVTGGGTGIGGAVARRFVNRGAQVVVVGRRVAVVEQLASEIGALALQCDVGVTASVEQTIAQLVERCGGLDIVVNNAATVQIGNVEQLDDAAWSSVVEVNVNGPMRVARAAIPHLRARGGGSIVNVSSIGGLFAAKNSAVYGTTKAALLGLTRSLARDYGREGIRVNTLCPGWVDTPMVEGALQMLARARGVSIGRSAWAAGREQSDQPHGRSGRDRPLRRIPRDRCELVRDRHGTGGRRRSVDRGSGYVAPHGAVTDGQQLHRAMGERWHAS